MNEAPKKPFERTRGQKLAADPARHVWVSASAGTGKTHVLTDRLMRLLLAGSAPDRILALTFTRAAAAEMQNRLTGRLGAWQTLDDAALDAELEALGAATGADARARARSLFALALDVPGGLKVQTIHAFAQGLLAAFPVEAGLPPGFVPLDERDQRQLRQRALNDAIVEAQQAGDTRFLDDLAELSVLKGEGGVMSAIDRMIAHTEGVLAFTSGDNIEPAIRRHLGVGADEQPGDRLREAFAPETHDDGRMEAFADAMAAWGTATGDKAALNIRAWLALDVAGRVESHKSLWSTVFTTKGEVQAYPGAIKKRPELRGLIDDIAADLQHLAEREARLATVELAGRVLRAGHRIVARYARLKRAQTAIDYDDMIRETAALLGRPGMPSYVGWKLDSRFDHVLVDEAQDTNERQWAIIASLVQDYFERDAERQRTLFVVGDQKQAIYGFQGTDPSLFQGHQARIAPAAQAGGRPLELVPLDRSFRSGPAVLDVVNEMLQQAGPAALGLAAAAPPHEPQRADAAGEVVLWPVLTPDQADDDSDDGAASDDGSEAADRLMAVQLAAQVARWLAPGPERLWLPARQRDARPEDILILVRKRGWLMGALVGRLHAEGVPVAGVDRLLLTEPYAVLDLLALVRFAVQPEDDLNLAALLVSPFLGWTHEAVRTLSAPRRADLWAALGEAARGSGPAAEARAFLGEVLSLADRGGPYAFLDTILSGPLGARRRLLARLGSEANDAIDELLAQALAFEQANPPALAGFLAWVEAEGSEVKRDAEAAVGQVRLMTIHGAKGLEAPVVVLADTAHKRRENRDGFLPVRLDNAGAPVPLFHPSLKAMPAALRAAHDAKVLREAEEDLRLLYVGLTRAADHLYIGGALGRTAYGRYLDGGADHCWHRRLDPVMKALPGVESIPTDWGEALRIRRGAWNEPAASATRVEPAAATQPLFDGIEIDQAPPPPRPTRPLTPSALPSEPGAVPATAALKAAGQRGSWLHRLFERLPGVSPARRADIAAAWLTAQGAPPAAIGPLVAEALAIIEDPAHAALFGPDALAEAPVAGLVGTGVVSGIVDRLLVTEGRVLVVDFKTSLNIPADAAAAPQPYKRQMALYRAVLQRAFPGRAVEAALLFTAAPKFILLDGNELDTLIKLD
jgi:ATP-dependent helicase/nuclease subunit A